MVYLALAFLLLRIATSTTVQLSLSPSDPGTEASEYEPDTSNFIFASFAGLLQQWPNTFAYSGHSIIPGVIPRSTLFYHATNESTAPQEGMEWLAFNPEMSYQIHNFRPGRFDLYTYVTTRPLRVIYIDGQSSALGTPGFMDSQSVLINGTVDREFGDKGRYLEAEYTRAKELCKIGKTHGFEGVVRMHTGFELIWCDFKQGIKIVQVINATDPLPVPDPEPDSPPWPPRLGGLYRRAGWISADAAARRYYAPGETRVRLDPSGFVSFYDGLKSLAIKRRADGTDEGPRSRHRLYGISPADARRVQRRLADALARLNARDWLPDPDQPDLQGIVLAIIEAYSGPLRQLAYALRRDDLDARARTVEVRGLSYQMLMPYLDLSAGDLREPALARQTVAKCREAYTAGIQPEDVLVDSVRLIVRTIEGTLDRLCTNVFDILAQAFPLAGLPDSAWDATRQAEARIKADQWRASTRELMAWLGWSAGEGCQRSCKPDEQCMIPMWPSVRGKLMTNLTDLYPMCRNFSTWEKSTERQWK